MNVVPVDLPQEALHRLAHEGCYNSLFMSGLQCNLAIVSPSDTAVHLFPQRPSLGTPFSVKVVQAAAFTIPFIRQALLPFAKKTLGLGQGLIGASTQHKKAMHAAGGSLRLSCALRPAAPCARHCTAPRTAAGWHGSLRTRRDLLLI